MFCRTYLLTLQIEKLSSTEEIKNVLFKKGNIGN
jgi:hypothetical protein